MICNNDYAHHSIGGDHTRPKGYGESVELGGGIRRTN